MRQLLLRPQGTHKTSISGVYSRLAHLLPWTECLSAGGAHWVISCSGNGSFILFKKKKPQNQTSSLCTELNKQCGTGWPSRDLLQKFAPDPNQSTNADAPNETRALLPILPETFGAYTSPWYATPNFKS